MGIQGLLPLLKDIQSRSSISSFNGQTVGIDAYCWLHKGAYGCAKDLIMGKPTRVYVNYVMKRVRMLIGYGVTPILVFDGGHLPAKAEKEKERRARRKVYKEKGLAALREEKTSQAFECFSKACDVTPEMASHVIQECAKLNVKCIVAPYEADAQLAYLMIQGITQLTISEDSDLLLYGCSKVFYKMGSDGDGILINIADLPKVRTVKLASFTLEQFRWMCMLSGCDYLPSIKGMGLIKAFKMLQRHKTVKQCIRALKIDRNSTVPPDYEENFRKSEFVFKYQLVFDFRTKCCVHLNSLENEIEEFSQQDLDYAGPNIDEVKALAIALGNIDPITGKSIGHLDDFASGDITAIPKKSTSWMSSTTSKQNTYQSKEKPKQRRVVSAYNVKNSVSVTDLTPPSSDLVEENCASKKSLFSSPEACAFKSLKRLSSELSEEPSGRESNWKKLYQQSVEPPSKRPVHNHHSVFNKSGSTRRLRNPFGKRGEVGDDDVPANTVVVSRYFASGITDESNSSSKEIELEERKGEEEIKSSDGQSDDTPSCTPTSDTNMSPSVTKNSPASKFNCSFIDYLDQTNCRMTASNSARKKIFHKSPKKVAQQKKINFTGKENLKASDQQESKTVERKLLSPVENNYEIKMSSKPEDIDFMINEKEESVVLSGERESRKKPIFYIDEDNVENNGETCEILCENSLIEDEESLPSTCSTACKESRSDDEEPVISDVLTTPEMVNDKKCKHLEHRVTKSTCELTDELDECPITTSQETVDNSEDLSQNSKQKLKIGLSKARCSGVGASSFIDKNEKQIAGAPQKITQMLEKLKNLPKDDVSKYSGSFPNLEEQDSESILTPAISSSFDSSKIKTIAINKTSSTALPKQRCKPIGLRRQKKKADSVSKSTNNGKDGLVQSKLSFNKFAYQKRKSFTYDDDDVMVIG